MNFKKTILLLVIAFSTATFAQKKQTETAEKEAINTILDSWHNAASHANFKEYFSALAENSIYIGTDATENWTKKEFEIWAKPYFDKGKAWNFTALQRNIYFSPDKKLAWFDELLNTQMKICRGSGVLEKSNGQWKIKHYVLSMTIPNDNSDEVIKAKEAIETKLIEDLKKQ